jgi:hypothetical protein
MNLPSELRAPRPHPRQLLATLTIGAAALIISAVLFGAALSASVVPSFRQWIPLPGGTTLEIGVVADCPAVMPEMACLHIEDQFPHAFRIVYWSAGEPSTLVSIALPRR